MQGPHLYIFRDVYSGKLYKVYEHNIFAARDKVAKLMNIPFYNLVRIQKGSIYYDRRESVQS